ncbi:MAG: hypothetical protein QGI83_11815 [Candidatus Latescibacteria bacterium]|jgi:hypothetical protein|nr:hypothetical protein [Candidatus Latescibacterota bacterium]
MSGGTNPRRDGTRVLVRFVLAAVIVVGCLHVWMGSAASQTMESEEWASGAVSLQTAYGRYAPKRIGLLLVGTEERPDPGFRYGGSPMQARKLLTQAREFTYSAHRLADFHEMHLYEALRDAFESRGYEVRCLNRGSWMDLRLKDIVAQSEGLDAACSVHYSIERTHKVVDDEGRSWWAPFEGMRLRIRLAVFDCASNDLIHEAEVSALSTEALYAGRGKMIEEEPLHPSGYDEHGNVSPYKIAIYETSVEDPKGEWTIPVIRTSRGSLDITYERAPDQVQPRRDPRTGVWVIPESQKRNTSVLRRLLQYVQYRPDGEEIEYLDGRTIDRCGEAVRGRIPERRP